MNRGEARLIAKILREMPEPAESVADLVDLLKFKLARLRIPWTPDAITTAVGWVHAVQPFRQAGRRTQGVVVPVNRRPSRHGRQGREHTVCRG
jgi:hypothetical protein